MEKISKYTNSSSSDKSSGVCQKLLTAFKVSPAFQTIRRISSRQRDPTPSPAVDDNRRHHVRAIEIKAKSATDHHHHHDHQQPKTGKAAGHVRAIPIKYVSTDTTTTTNDSSVVVERASSGQNNVVSGMNDVVSLPDKRKLPEGEISSQRKKKPETRDINATFTEYIEGVRNRIRRNPESDGGDHQKKSTVTDQAGIIKKKGSVKEHFSDYIHSKG